MGRPMAHCALALGDYIPGEQRALEARDWFLMQPMTLGNVGLRNVAIIAHVDHGKTTLVDRLLQQSGAVRDNQRVAERALDSNDLERERGITILAKVTSILWHDTRINIVDTPGHADFGGEVERILNMVDGALVLVDAAEGPLPQTKFVVSKALKVGLKHIVVINKVDRPDAQPLAVVNEVFDLFAALEANEAQLDFPILYGSAREGWMAAAPDGPKDQGMAPLFNLVTRHVAEPIIEDGPFRMLGTILEANPDLGRIVTGRISSGAVRPNQSVKVLDRNGKLIEHGRRASSDGGTVRPSALAVCALMTNSNLLDCTTGKSAGLRALKDASGIRETTWSRRQTWIANSCHQRWRSARRTPGTDEISVWSGDVGLPAPSADKQRKRILSRQPFHRPLSSWLPQPPGLPRSR